MRKFALIAALVMPAAASAAMSSNAPSVECLVNNTDTSCPTAVPTRTAIEIQNLGPNPIYCNVNATSSVAVLNKSRRLLTGETYVINDIGPGPVVHCICSVLQVTGAATIITEKN